MSPLDEVSVHFEGLTTQVEEAHRGAILEYAKDKANTFRMPTTAFSPSVEKAIQAGHYTPEQIAVLRAQKQNLVNIAMAAAANFEQSKFPTDLSLQSNVPSQPIDSNPHLPFPIMNEVEDTVISETTLKEKSTHVPQFRMFPQCNFQACQVCRPTYRDRTWQCLEEIMASKPPESLEALEDTNRPFASASIMRSIGLRTASRKPPIRRPDSRALYEFDGEGGIIFKNRVRHIPGAIGSGDVTDVASAEDAGVEPESKGFRESMKRAFKGMLANRRSNSRSGRKARIRESTSDEDAAEFDMGLWKQMNDDLLNEASNIPLPVKDSMDTMATRAEQSDVRGVAVTEEAADLNAADIIMSI